ncbi:MAG: YggT family protein [Ilumatobacteraceae bacterium]|jgi:YggT family protein|nr:YggT family protein [Ilumatobacteraceae bacterium]MDP5069149.1 YggT family protein [Ilumatobacteraceae bacterium]
MGLVCAIANIYVLIVIARTISTFFPISSGSPLLPVVDFLYKATEPVFAPIRRVLPTVGPFDFTPVVVIIGVNIVARILGC